MKLWEIFYILVAEDEKDIRQDAGQQRRLRKVFRSLTALLETRKGSKEEEAGE